MLEQRARNNLDSIPVGVCLLPLGAMAINAWRCRYRFVRHKSMIVLFLSSLAVSIVSIGQWFPFGKFFEKPIARDVLLYVTLLGPRVVGSLGYARSRVGYPLAPAHAIYVATGVCHIGCCFPAGVFLLLGLLLL